MKDSSIKKIIIVLALVLVFALCYILLDKLNESNSDGTEEFLKNYEVNEYITTYISDEAMAKIYFNEYIHNMYYDVSYAYNTLDKEYRNKKFGSLNSYKEYVDSLDYSSFVFSKYYKTSKDGYIIFGVYDDKDNLYIFKTEGVMQYKVYLDDYTVGI